MDKDLFIEIYRNYLSKRLLNDKSESIDLEKTVITEIKMSCGPVYTKKLEGMISDLNLAKTEQKKFDDFLVTKPGLLPANIEFKVQVLTTSYWPNQQDCQGLSIPPTMSSCI